MRLDLADLRLFLMVVEAGSITAGAERAHLALASTSERLRTMEAEAGITLLTRHPRGVTTTEAGEALAHHARLMLRQQSLLREELQEFASGARGTLHLYANTGANRLSNCALTAASLARVCSTLSSTLRR